MSFNRKKLSQKSYAGAEYPAGSGWENKQEHIYSETTETLANITAASYFAAAADESVGGDGTLKDGDLVLIFASDGVGYRYCTDATAGTIDGVLA